MIHFTKRAREWTHYLRESLGRKDAGLRIAISGGGICAGYQYFIGFENEPTAEDIHFSVGDFSVYVDPVSYTEIEGSRVDFVDSPDGCGFVVHLHPDKIARHTCCCSKDGVLDEEKKKQVAELKAQARKDRSA